MKYIVLAGDGARNFIAELQEDGTYTKIAQLFDNTAGAKLVASANSGANGEI